MQRDAPRSFRGRGWQAGCCRRGRHGRFQLVDFAFRRTRLRTPHVELRDAECKTRLKFQSVDVLRVYPEQAAAVVESAQQLMKGGGLCCLREAGKLRYHMAEERRGSFGLELHCVSTWSRWSRDSRSEASGIHSEWSMTSESAQRALHSWERGNGRAP